MFRTAYSSPAGRRPTAFGRLAAFLIGWALLFAFADGWLLGT